MIEPVWDIRREGRAWGGEEAGDRINRVPGKTEMTGGKLYWSDEERLTMLALLLENVGIDRAVQLGDPALWRAAVAELPDDTSGS
jgi:hypothetical protein